jgi:Transposase
MPYRIAGIDVHKRMLAVVVSEVEVEGEYHFERRHFGANPAQLRSLAEWFIEQQVEEVVMESTAQYWKPVWGVLERYWKPICLKREGAVRCRERCIWHRRSRIERGRGARMTLPTLNVW